MKKILLLILVLLFVACQPKGFESIDLSYSSKVDEKVFAYLGEEYQYVELIGQSKDNPILLFIHGGP